MENPGVDPGTSRMQSGRSTIWANSPVFKEIYHAAKISLARESRQLTRLHTNPLAT